MENAAVSEDGQEKRGASSIGRTSDQHSIEGRKNIPFNHR